MQLGAATRSTDRPGQLYHFWKRDDVEISLGLKGRSERLDFVISNQAPTQFATFEQSAGDYSFERHLEKLGLDVGQWHVLKNYLLDLQYGSNPLPPDGLQNHPIVNLALNFQQTSDRSNLDRAASKLAGSSNQTWLILEKS